MRDATAQCRTNSTSMVPTRVSPRKSGPEPEPPDKNSPDAKKTKNGKTQDKKNRNEQKPDKLNQTDGQKDTETEAEGNATAPSMSANKRSRLKSVPAFMATRQTGGDDTAAIQDRASAETPSRSWWESFLDPTAWLAGIMSLTSFAAVWQDNRKRKDTDV